MSRIADVHGGLAILLNYAPDGSTCAEHDEIFAEGPPPEKMSAEDRDKLASLRWRYDATLPSWQKFT